MGGNAPDTLGTEFALKADHDEKEDASAHSPRRNPAGGIHEAQQGQPEQAGARHRHQPRAHQRHRARPLGDHRAGGAAARQVFQHYAGALDEPAGRLRTAQSAPARMAEDRKTRPRAGGGVTVILPLRWLMTVLTFRGESCM